MDAPAFQVLDVVEVGPSVPAHLEQLIGARAIVTQVRRYADGRSRYAVAGSDSDEVTGLWGEEHLRATGEMGSLEPFRSPGHLRMRDVVVVQPNDHEFAHLAGSRGVIDGWSEGEKGEPTYVVWIEHPEEQSTWLFTEAELQPTGERLPPPVRGRPGHSVRVREDGTLVGAEDYVILDDLSDHL